MLILPRYGQMSFLSINEWLDEPGWLMNINGRNREYDEKCTSILLIMRPTFVSLQQVARCVLNICYRTCLISFITANHLNVRLYARLSVIPPSHPIHVSMSPLEVIHCISVKFSTAHIWHLDIVGKMYL